MEQILGKGVSSQKDLLNLLKGIVKITIDEKIVYSTNDNVGGKGNELYK